MTWNPRSRPRTALDVEGDLITGMYRQVERLCAAGQFAQAEAVYERANVRDVKWRRGFAQAQARKRLAEFRRQVQRDRAVMQARARIGR
jgi:hypothetical protein